MADETSNVPISGHVAPGFEPVMEAFEANFASGEEQGAGFALRIGGLREDAQFREIDLPSLPGQQVHHRRTGGRDFFV